MIERAAYDALRVALRIAIQLWPLWLFWFVWSFFDDRWRGILLTFPDRSTQGFAFAWHVWPAAALFGPILLMAAAIGATNPGLHCDQRDEQGMTARLICRQDRPVDVGSGYRKTHRTHCRGRPSVDMTTCSHTSMHACEATGNRHLARADANFRRWNFAALRADRVSRASSCNKSARARFPDIRAT